MLQDPRAPWRSGVASYGDGAPTAGSSYRDGSMIIPSAAKRSHVWVLCADEVGLRMSCTDGRRRMHLVGFVPICPNQIELLGQISPRAVKRSNNRETYVHRPSGRPRRRRSPADVRSRTTTRPKAATGHPRRFRRVYPSRPPAFNCSSVNDRLSSSRSTIGVRITPGHTQSTRMFLVANSSAWYAPTGPRRPWRRCGPAVPRSRAVPRSMRC